MASTSKAKKMQKYFALTLASVFIFTALIGLIVPLLAFFA